MKRNGVAEGRGRWGLGTGYPPLQWGRVWEKAVPLPQKFFLIFLSGNGAFWCILGASFNVSIRHVKQSRKAVANWSVISHGGRIINDIIRHYCLNA